MLLILVCDGCSISIFPPRPSPKFFILDSEPDVAAAKTRPNGSSTAASSPIALGLGPVRFPQYLDRLEMVTRIDNNRIAISDTDRWAAPLNDAFERVLAQDLSAHLPNNSRIAIYPWYEDRRPDLQLRITVDRFDVSTNRMAELVASWTITDPATDALLHSDSSEIRQSIDSGKPADPAEALSQTLAEFSSRVAVTIEQVSRETSH
jgi:uncharacterized lipoprotein YmbA